MMFGVTHRSTLVLTVAFLVACAPEPPGAAESNSEEAQRAAETVVQEGERSEEPATVARSRPEGTASLSQLSASSAPSQGERSAAARGLTEARSSLLLALPACVAELDQYAFPLAIRARVLPSRDEEATVLDYASLAGDPFRAADGRAARCLQTKIGTLSVALPRAIEEVDADGVEVLSVSDEGMAVEFRFEQAELLKPQ